MTPSEERNWALTAHLSAFLTAWFAFGFIGPLVVLLLAGNRSPFVRAHGIESLNFNLSVLIYAIVSGILTFILVGFLMLVILGLIYVVTVIRATIAASKGHAYRYPITIRFVS